jgi:hypothetical protein
VLTPATGNLRESITLGIVTGVLHLIIFLGLNMLISDIPIVEIFDIQTPILFITYTIVSVFIFSGLGGAILEIISTRYNRG